MKRIMPPLLPELSARFAAAIETAYGAEYAGTDPVIRRSQQAKFGDFQANAAMALAKRVGRGAGQSGSVAPRVTSPLALSKPRTLPTWRSRWRSPDPVSSTSACGRKH